MAVNIHNLIAAINPNVYCSKWDDALGESPREKISKMVKDALESPDPKIRYRAYLDAAKKAKPIPSDYLEVWDTRFTKSAFSLSGLKNPTEKRFVSYDASAQSLEQIYFWILEYMNRNTGKTEKLTDNFVTSATSGHFAEISGRKTRMQEEAMKMMGSINTVLRSVLNIIYDLKEFKIRLAEYDNYHSSDKTIKNAALLALKQMWMDNVDFVKRGNSSIKAMAAQFDYVTIIDAFMASNSLDDVTKKSEDGGLDLNERVRRILQQRLSEFFHWVEESEKELRKRFEIEKTYLRSQINSLKLYARWVKPYLKAARQLEQRASESADLVHGFNTAIFELSVLASSPYNIDSDVQQGDLPNVFLKLQKNNMIRKYYSVVIVEFNYRSIPDRTDQRGGYSFRGKADVTFTSYSLNEDELKILREEIEKDDLGDVLSLEDGATSDSIAQIQADVDEVLGKKEEKKEEKEEDSNPFSALFSFLKFEKKEKKDEKKDLSKGIEKDNPEELVVRSQSIISARWNCRKLSDDFKKSLGLPAFPPVMGFS